MAIRPRGAKWAVDVTHMGIRRTDTAESEIQAKQLEASILASLMQEVGVPSKNGGWTLLTAYTKTFERVWAGGRSEKFVKGNWNGVVGYFGKATLLSDIDTSWVDRWILHLEDTGKANGTINRYLALLSRIFSFAKSRGVISSSPIFSRKKEPMGRIRYLTPEEEATLLHLMVQWGREDLHDLCVVLIDTGIRLGEATRLQAKDISGNMLSIWDNKADLPRSIPLTLRVQAALARRVKLLPQGGPLFKFTDAQIRNTWDRARGVMGFTKDLQFVPHMLRHTCATRLVQRGFPIAKVQKWMGHKTIAVTMRYSHLGPQDLAEGAALLEPQKTA